MTIPSRPIGQDPVSQQLWRISKQLERLIQVASNGSVTTTAIPSKVSLTFNDIANADLLISGSSSNLSDWNGFFGLPYYGSLFTSVSIVGNTVELMGGSGITLREGIFDDDGGYGVNLLSFVDTGCIIHAGNDCFGTDSNAGCPNLTILSLPALISAGDVCFLNCIGLTHVSFPSLLTAGSGCFSNCYGLIAPDFPSLINAGGGCFDHCHNLVTADFPNLKIVGDSCFSYCYNLTTINLPACTNLGTTVGNNIVFHEIANKIINLTVPSALMTCNDGQPDGDIFKLGVYNTLTVNGTPFIPFTGYTGNLSLTFNNIINVPVADPASVADWNTFFNLSDWSTPFSSVNVNSNTVELIGGENIRINAHLFEDSPNITEVVDAGCVCYLGANCFSSCVALTNISFPNVTIADDECFYGCTGLTTPTFPDLQTAGDGCFYVCSGFVNPDFSSLGIVGSNCFAGCTSLTNIYLPVCTNLGGTVDNNDVFANIIGNTITLTIPSLLMTCNNGNPDGDIQYLTDPLQTNTVTIVLSDTTTTTSTTTTVP